MGTISPWTQLNHGPLLLPALSAKGGWRKWTPMLPHLAAEPSLVWFRASFSSPCAGKRHVLQKGTPQVAGGVS